MKCCLLLNNISIGRIPDPNDFTKPICLPPKKLRDDNNLSITQAPISEINRFFKDYHYEPGEIEKVFLRRPYFTCLTWNHIGKDKIDSWKVTDSLFLEFYLPLYIQNPFSEMPHVLVLTTDQKEEENHHTSLFNEMVNSPPDFLSDQLKTLSYYIYGDDHTKRHLCSDSLSSLAELTKLVEDYQKLCLIKKDKISLNKFKRSMKKSTELSYKSREFHTRPEMISDLCSVLECILLNKNHSGEILKKLTRRIIGLLGNSIFPESRVRLVLKESYRLRSNFVHGREACIFNANKRYNQKLLEKSLAKENDYPSDLTTDLPLITADIFKTLIKEKILLNEKELSIFDEQLR